MPTLIVADLHGDYAGLEQLLIFAGAIDHTGVKQPGWHLIQIGDLIHGGQPGSAPPRHGVDDNLCLERGLALFDEIVIGNHELPHLYPDAGFPRFDGQGPLPHVVAARLFHAREAGRFTPATSVGDWLITHAGLLATLVGRLHPDVGVAERAHASTLAALLRMRFARRLAGGERTALFDAVGVRDGGRAGLGGIFWNDWRELVAYAAPVPQIVGHTRLDRPRREGDLWGIDVGAALSGRVCGLLRGDTPDADWRPIVMSGSLGGR